MIAPTPTADDLLVFYFPDENEWATVCGQMLAAGFTEVDAHNPYWDQNGRTFQDLDGYLVVLARHSWR